MSYSAPNRLLMPARHSIDTLHDSWLPPLEVQTATAWGTANRAIYVPLCVPSSVVVRKLWVGTGTITTNVDMALYDASGVAVISGTAGTVSSSTEAVFDVTDTTIGPGLYYIAVVSDSATDTILAINAATPILTAMGVLTEASAYPLPATATFAISHTLAFVPIAGILLEATAA